MAEELALDQLLGDGPAVHDDERLAVAPRAGVEPARDQLLARAALAVHEHALVAGGDAIELPLQAHGRRALRGDDDGVGRGVSGRGAQPRVLAQHRAVRHGAPDRLFERVEIDGLGQEVEGAALHGLHRERDRAVAGADDDGRGRVRGRDLWQQVHAGRAREPKIEQHGVRVVALQRRDGAAAVGQRVRGEAHLLELARQHPPQALVVLDEQHRLPPSGHSARTRRLR